MKRLALHLTLPLLAIFAAHSCASQTPTPIPVTGNLGSITGSPAPDAYVRLTLQNCAGGNPTITNYQGIVQTTAQLVADGSGNVTGSVWPNDIINCGGTTGASMYARTIIANDVPVGQTLCYQVRSTQGTWNLSVQQPISCSPTPPNPTDGQYTNLNVTGCLTVDGGSCYPANPSGGGGGAISSVTGGTGINVSPTTGAVVVTNTGVTSVSAGAGITVDHSGSDGGVTISASPTVSAVAALPSYLAMYYTNNAIEGIPFISIAQGGTGKQTAAEGLAALGGAPLLTGGSTGLLYQDTSTTVRRALQADLLASLGYTPVNTAGSFLDVQNPADALKNLFYGAGNLAVPLLATDEFGVPVPVTVGSGLSFTPATSTGTTFSVVAAKVTIAIGGFASCPTVTFTGGGGSGAAATVTCRGIGPYFVNSVIMTSYGSGYTSSPTITSTPVGITGTGTLGNPGLISFNPSLTTPISINDGTGAGGSLTATLGTAPTPGATVDTFWADSGSGRWTMNNSNTGALKVPGVSTPGVTGDCWAYGANGIDPVDSGYPCASVMSGTPASVSANSSAGNATGGTASLTSGAGSSDSAGYVTVVTGTCASGPCPTGSGLFTLSFSHTYGAKPVCSLFPADANAAALGGNGPWINQPSTTTALFVARIGAVGLAFSTTYTWGYSCKLP